MYSLLTLSWSFEYDIELLHVIVDERYLIVTHHELHDIRLYSSLRTAHLATTSRSTPRIWLLGLKMLAQFVFLKFDV